MTRISTGVFSVVLVLGLYCGAPLLLSAADDDLTTAINLQPLSATVSLSRQLKESPFRTPQRLRGRVNFWKDVFTKWGKNQAVIHHRLFPQAVFEVVSFDSQADRMNGVELERYKERVLKEKLDEYKASFSRLAAGAGIQTSLDSRIVEVMALVPGSTDTKFQRVVDEDLIRTQTGIRERYAEAIRRSGRYLPMMEQIFSKEFGLPKELTRLPFVESSFDYQAYSAVGAAGIWQFMPSTARHYMMVNKLIDERRDPLASTRAAAQYLIGAQQRLGSWPLALTSYNHGIAGVLNKVKIAGTADIVELIENPEKQAFGFASSNFYPEFLAALEIYEQHQRYFPEVALEPALSLRELAISKPISLDFAARQVGVSREVLEQVNYAFSKAILQGKAKIPAGYRLRVPGKGATMHSSLRAPEPDAPKVVSPKIAPSSAPEKTSAKKSSTTAMNSKKQVSSSTQAPRSSYHVVKPGETLYSIARDRDSTVKAIQKANRLKSARVTVGQKLQIP